MPFWWVADSVGEWALERPPPSPRQEQGGENISQGKRIEQRSFLQFIKYLLKIFWEDEEMSKSIQLLLWRFDDMRMDLWNPCKIRGTGEVEAGEAWRSRSVSLDPGMSSEIIKDSTCKNKMGNGWKRHLIPTSDLRHVCICTCTILTHTHRHKETDRHTHAHTFPKVIEVSIDIFQ